MGLSVPCDLEQQAPPSARLPRSEQAASGAPAGSGARDALSHRARLLGRAALCILPLIQVPGALSDPRRASGHGARSLSSRFSGEGHSGN